MKVVNYLILKANVKGRVWRYSCSDLSGSFKPLKKREKGTADDLDFFGYLYPYIINEIVKEK